MTTSSTNRCSSCAARPCARRWSTPSPRSTRSSRGACPCSSAASARDEPTFDSTDPGAPDRVVAQATVATAADVDAAVRAAARAAPAWEARGAHARAAILSRAAGELRRRRSTLAALAVRECAKPWAEADADVCEAIDFLEYYAQQAVALEASNGLVQLPGERNTLRYAARGVVAVVGPWNFPLAIPPGWSPPAWRPATASCSSPPSSRPRARSRSSRPCTPPASRERRLNFLPGEGDVGARARRPPRRAHDRLHGLRRRRPGDPAQRAPSSRPASAISSASWPRWAARTA